MYILAIDQGTSSTKALILGEGKVLANGRGELESIYPETGYVEQDPEVIYQSVLAAVKNCINNFRAQGGDPSGISACGISNQRETFVLWDNSGKPLHNAVVWQCKRSISICDNLRENGMAEILHKKTGLLIDPYFSGSKVMHLYQKNENVRKAIESGNCFFGTIDTWVLFRLTGAYFTDFTNACRTMFMNINSLQWDHELLEQFSLSKLNLPEIHPSASHFGNTTFEGLVDHMVPITGMMGDSHAAAFGEKIFEKGSAKVTLGTGSSVLWNTGNSPVFSKNGLVTTICWSSKDRVDYALEGVIVSCGSIIEWLKNELGLFAESTDTEEMAQAVSDNGGVILIPSFSGMGAPYWRMDARGAITGLTFGTRKEHIVRASLEAIAFQLKDIITLMENESSAKPSKINIHGGLSGNRFVTGMISNLLSVPVSVSVFPDISGLGAALIAGLGADIFSSMDEVKSILNDSLSTAPNNADNSLQQYETWKNAVMKHLSK